MQHPIAITVLYIHHAGLFVTLMFCDTKDLLVRTQFACLKELPTSMSIYIYKQWHLLLQCDFVTPMKRAVRRKTTKIDLVQQRLSKMFFASLCLTRMYGMLTRLQVGRLSNRGFDYRQGQDNYQTASGTHPTFYKTVLETLSWCVKRLGLKADQFTASRMCEATVLASPYDFMHRRQLYRFP